MKYFRIENALDDKIIGPNFDQIGYQSPSPILFSAWEYPKIDGPITLELEDRALITDFLKATATNMTAGFFIEEKVKTIFSEFNLVDHRYYRANLLEAPDLRYYWMHVVDLSILDRIDYQKSRFFRTDFGTIEDSIDIESYEHYKQLKNDRGVFFDVETDELWLSVESEFDFFTLLPFDSDMFISERLLRELEKAKITGFNAQEAQSIHCN